MEGSPNFEGSFRFKDSDLEIDAIECVRETLGGNESLIKMPPLSSDEIEQYVGAAIKYIRNKGNQAVYDGLILRIAEIALGMARKPR
ncbi:MAG: hypothetical protein AABX79_00295 [Nanoarchaeota archaeon]